ncbi:hypothetical protein BSL78_26628 [Apostichopus japonicus]|uniref:Uncharacterized protein n=1 Tax=Stichopus japonicus TaxID=307972 RepID=A0A2G8JLA5_STIJA|nr:hypothetical protein BSL78_26628 [Apostichopus japonicus]
MGCCYGKDSTKESVEQEESEHQRLLGPANGRTPDKPMYGFPYGLTANVNSIQGKFLHLEQTVTNMRNLCFITLQETKLQSPNKEWLNEIPQHCVPDEALRMANYFMFRHDRQFSANGVD